MPSLMSFFALKIVSHPRPGVLKTVVVAIRIHDRAAD